MADDIKLVVGVDYSELTGLVKTSQETKRVLSSAAKEFARTGNQSQYMHAISKIVQAQKQLAASSRMTRPQLMKLGAEMQREVKFTDALTASTKRLTVAQGTSAKVMQQTKNKMNGNNMAIQQLGYQFGDFAVQVQGGTSAFVAFSQQGSQLAGILPMIAGPLGLSMGAAVGLSAALGILIPVGSAVARMFFEMKGSASDAADSIDTFVSSLSTIEGSIRIGRTSIQKLKEEFGEMAEVAKGLQGYLQQVAVENAMTSMNEAVNPFSVELAKSVEEARSAKNILEDLNRDIADGYVLASDDIHQAEINSQKSILTAMQDRFKIDPAQMAGLQAILDEVSKAIELEDVRDSSGAALQFLEELRSTSSEVSPELNAIAMELQKVFVASARASAELDGSAQAAREAGDALGEGEDSQVRALRLAQDDLKIQKLKNEILKSHNDAGEATSDTLALQVDLAGEIAKIRAEQKFIEGGITDAEQEQIDKLVSAARQAELLSQGIASAADNASSLESALKGAAAAMNNLTSFGDGLERTLAVSIAKVQALREGTSEAIAGQIVGMEVDLAARVQAARDADTTGTSGTEIDLMAAEGLRFIDAIEETLAEADRLREANKPSSGGNKGFSQDEYLSGLHDEAKFKHTLVRLSAEQVTEDERRRQIIMKIQSEGKVVEEARVEAILETEAATRKAIAAEEQRQSTMDMVTDNIENAFMSIVDGSKSVEDAFKSMLRNIILEIYQQQVAQPAATAIGGFLKDLFMADGGAFSGGSQIQAYANGGVVGGPTTFGMAGGKTGLMGEAGPEAIMPLKRGANGKLGVQMEGGGGGDVININQSFNFQANGDDSVKKLIAQAAPKIADMAKASVIESRRRGGSTKAAFG